MNRSLLSPTLIIRLSLSSKSSTKTRRHFIWGPLLCRICELEYLIGDGSRSTWDPLWQGGVSHNGKARSNAQFGGMKRHSIYYVVTSPVGQELIDRYPTRGHNTYPAVRMHLEVIVIVSKFMCAKKIAMMVISSIERRHRNSSSGSTMLTNSYCTESLLQENGGSPQARCVPVSDLKPLSWNCDKYQNFLVALFRKEVL